MSEKATQEEIVENNEEVCECNEDCACEQNELSNEEIALKAELDKANEEVAKLKDAYLRANADFDNYKKRLEKDKQSAVLYAQEGLLKDLIPVLDALENACNFEADDEFSKQLKQGIENTLSLFKNILAKHGIAEIVANVGDEFNPNYHEAMMHVESDLEPNCVAAMFQKGYILNERIIRASKVSVSK
ncbi:DnaK system nucleotide exchange factor GrpE [Campylobacter sp. RM5004]|uniref:nucleotide exchange factor GrpE n=1 Tax=Campylobacter sp. RM5004 TaxID=1660078 RepID=UPI001EFC0EDA|nr:nucleotide exchange factor GrpE [Campylobacter sp. RM5004]ULO01856.1 DnaK system nucleotide exchange factor GrpE [Campylobacter sp. RM5004]